MSSLKRRTFGAVAVCTVAALMMTGCSSGKNDVGSTAPPVVSDTGSATDTAGGAGASDSAGAGSTSVDTGSADSGSVDTGSAGSGSVDTGSAGSGSADTGSAGSGSADSSSVAPGSGGSSGPIKIAAIDKQGTQQYFVDQANGAKEAAAAAGATITVTDVQLDSNAAINAINTAIGQKVSGIIITVPDQKIGPQAIELAKAAGIPLIATNDPIKDASGAAAPFVGFNSTQMGESVGKKAGELYKAAGWSAADTRILNIQKEDLSDCVDRGKGAIDAFTKAAGADIPKVIDVSTDAATPQAIDKTGAALTSNPTVKNWVVWGCNDESETGGVTELQNAGFGADTVIGVGLGAYLTCKDWKAGAKTGNKAALFIGGKSVGGTAVKELVALIKDGTPLPAETIAPSQIVDMTNWEKAGVECT